MAWPGRKMPSRQRPLPSLSLRAGRTPSWQPSRVEPLHGGGCSGGNSCFEQQPAARFEPRMYKAGFTSNSRFREMRCFRLWLVRISFLDVFSRLVRTSSEPKT